MAAQRLERSVHASAGTVICVVCEAVYTPSPSYEHLLQAPAVALESAFMGMCHFCFRCRRPACPACWDDVHGVCGACSLETSLPFRSVSPPLNGALLSPSRQAQAVRAKPDSLPLVCVRPGRFQKTTSASAGRFAPDSLESGNKSRVAGGRRKARAAGDSGRFSGQSEADELIDEIPTQVSGAVKPVHPASPFDIDVIETRPQGRKRLAVWNEQVLTFFVSLVVVTVVLMIMLAVLSDKANAMIAGTLHVDIRAEIEYLWRLIGRH
ncbi:MAG TPA: hypothetical protein VFU49_05210 [Ktedonobacteraceae bacterium]|nr:hypothetical protein [Ktedonobacteraceae bacterium]